MIQFGASVFVLNVTVAILFLMAGLMPYLQVTAAGAGAFVVVVVLTERMVKP